MLDWLSATGALTASLLAVDAWLTTFELAISVLAVLV